MDCLNDDIINLIHETIQNNSLQNKTIPELLDLDIVEYIFIYLKQLHNISFKIAEKKIVDQLLNYKNSNYINSNLYIEINSDEINDENSELSDTAEIEINLAEIDISGESSINKRQANSVIQASIINEDDFINLDINIINEKMNTLKNIVLPEQRSLEWYKFRHNMITASDLYKVNATEGIRRELIIKKCCPIDPNKRVGGGNACKHGIKYEPIATSLYELRKGVSIIEFGCIPHQDHNLPFGASPDGICSENNQEYGGRMLEIKCPYSRKITGIVPDMYWKQVQGQLEVCDLEVCDFLECKLEEYENEEEFDKDGTEFLTNNKMEKGVIVVYSDMENNMKYVYGEIGLEKELMKNWISDEIDKILDDPNKNFIEITWWKLTIFSCVLIKRDKEWFSKIRPEIINLWNEIEYYRKAGVDQLIAQKRKKKIKDKNKNMLDKCLIESDED